MTESLSTKSKLLRIRTKLMSLRQQLLDADIKHVLEYRYDPSQPRVPAGSPSGGQWASGGGSDVSTVHQRDREAVSQGERLKTNNGAGRITLAARRTLAECKVQYDRDMFHCKLVGLKSCYAQAAVRWIACEKGHPIPPLNY
jgi:hypothetical protein